MRYNECFRGISADFGELKNLAEERMLLIKNDLKETASCVIMTLKRKPTSKWMLPRMVFNVLTDTASPVCRQERHFYFFLLFLLSRKVRHATIKLPKEISKPIIPINIKMISAAVILRTSLLMYSGEPVIKRGRLPPCHGLP